MSGTMVVLFPALHHVIPSDYEAWFEQMAAEGWHIDTIKQWDSVFIKFHRGIPKQYRFVYDPQVSPRKAYIPFYEQFGWEHLGCMASAHIWRMEYDGEPPQAFSDQEGLAERNRRNITAASVSFFLFLAAVIVLSLAAGFAADSLSVGARNQLIAAATVFGAIDLALGYVLIQMWKSRYR